MGLHSAALGFALYVACLPAYLPGRLKLDWAEYQLRLLPLALLGLLGLWLCVRARPGGTRPARGQALAAGAGLLWLLAGFPMHAAQVSRYQGLGYRLDWPLLQGLSAGGGLLLTWMAWRRARDWRRWSAAVLGLWAALALYSLAHYPLVYDRSDMLFLLRHGGEAWGRGASLSDAYAPAPALRLTYLPGLWLGYLPATLAGLDLRWASLAGLLAAVLLLMHATDPARRAWLPALLALYLLNPWLHFRHECYVWGLLPAAAALGWGAAKGRFWILALAAGWLAAKTQLAWILLPFVAWHARLRWGWGRAVGLGLVVAAVLALTVGPYWLWDREDFTRNVLRQWEGLLWPESANLSWWASRWVGVEGLRPLQALALGGVFLAFRRRLGSSQGLLAALAVGLTLFIALNSLVREYFYFFSGFFLLFALTQAPPNPAGPSREGLPFRAFFDKNSAPKPSFQAGDTRE